MTRIGFRIAAAMTGLLLALAGCAWTGHPAEAPAASPATFTVDAKDLRQPLTLIAYGDMRFTDPANVTATNPKARQALIARIAQERPDGVFLNGDVPYIGGNPDDYAEYHRETTAWRDAGLRVYPPWAITNSRNARNRPACATGGPNSPSCAVCAGTRCSWGRSSTASPSTATPRCCRAAPR